MASAAASSLQRALARAEIERERASRAARVAERHTSQASGAPTQLRIFHLRMAAVHHQICERHLAAARLHASYAASLGKWIGQATPQEQPLFMGTVAEAFGSDCAVVSLLDTHRTEALVAASNPIAQAAQDLEFVLGEGPVRQVVSSHRPIFASASELPARWPTYGPAARRLGVRTVAAFPLQLPEICFGAVAAFNLPQTGSRRQMSSLQTVAEALTHSVLLSPDSVDLDETLLCLPLFEEADSRASIHQAAGITSVQCGCSVEDALALLRARAFANGEPIEALALRVIRRQVSMADSAPP